MKNIYLSSFLLIIVLFTSCTITQEFHFNKDFSGNYKSTIDMTQFVDMINSLDSTSQGTDDFKDSLDLILSQTVKKLDSAGVSNLKYGWNDNKFLYISYDFANIDVLNKALNKSGMNENTPGNENFIFFIRNGKTLIYQGVSPDETTKGGADLGAMKDYYKYKAIFTFERKIKKTDNPIYKISNDKHTAEMEAPLFDITKKDFNLKIRFKLK